MLDMNDIGYFIYMSECDEKDKVEKEKVSQDSRYNLVERESTTINIFEMKR